MKSVLVYKQIFFEKEEYWVIYHKVYETIENRGATLAHYFTKKQSFPYRSIPPISSGTYRSAKLTVREPPATGRYHQSRPSAVDFGHRRLIEGEKGKKKKKKKKRKRRKKKKEEKKKEYLVPSLPACRRYPRVAHAPLPPSPAGRSRAVAALTRDFSPAQGERSRRRLQYHIISLGMYQSDRGPIRSVQLGTLVYHHVSIHSVQLDCTVPIADQYVGMIRD
ncbi:hypothetical protein BHM03_00028986 [Ensete ventricosum]|nr:hypothetical protein BHM03_00028986 [Ensete ventricosum]